MSGRHNTPPLPPGAAEAAPHEYLALRARLRVALLLAELARLAVREYEAQSALRELVTAPIAAAAAAELACALDALSKGQR